MLTVKLTLGPNTLDIEGDLPLADVVPIVTGWLAAVQSLDPDPSTLRELTARLSKSTAALAAADAAASPSPGALP